MPRREIDVPEGGFTSFEHMSETLSRRQILAAVNAYGRVLSRTLFRTRAFRRRKRAAKLALPPQSVTVT